jgi:hypothetical protein
LLLPRVWERTFRENKERKEGVERRDRWWQS